MNIRLCPFCGGEAGITEAGRVWGFPSYAVVCGDCGARSDSYPNKEDVVEAWNRRVRDDAPNARLEAKAI